MPAYDDGGTSTSTSAVAVAGRGRGSARVNSEYTDPTSAFAAYTSAAHRGHTVSLQRIGHMMKGGLGEGATCQSALHSFKLVSERGDWSGELARAAMLYRQVTRHTSYTSHMRTCGTPCFPI